MLGVAAGAPNILGIAVEVCPKAGGSCLAGALKVNGEGVGLMLDGVPKVPPALLAPPVPKTSLVCGVLIPLVLPNGKIGSPPNWLKYQSPRS